METIEQPHQRKIEVCYSPALFPVYYHSTNCVVVIIDIFRATSAICTAFAHGVSKIIPVSSIEDARRYQREGYLVAAERNGEVVQGFDIGNSPFHYMDEGLNGKEIVMTTTNGTKAVERARAADHVIVASFLNLTAVVKYLREMNKNVILLCAGWKDRFNLEDTLFAGAVVNQLKRESHFTGLADSSLAADHLYQLAADDVYGFLSNSSHRRRLSRLHLEKDIEFCLQKDEFDKVPYLSGNAIVA